MDLTDPAVLFSGFAISMIGVALFIYGRKADKLRSLAMGIVLMALPFFIPSVLWLWIAAGACITGVFVLPEGG